MSTVLEKAEKMRDNYLLYLTFINRKLEKHFADQAPYIYCHKGCARCCQYGDYPFNHLEIQYILEGFSKLPEDKKRIILKNIEKTKQEKINFQGEQFTYQCPFLINNECSVYDYRGIICRSFGLISSRDDENSKIPFCAYEGLNYSNVLDPETNTISEEKFLALNIEQEPLAYKVRYKDLISDKFEDVFNLNFGEVKSLIDWFM